MATSNSQSVITWRQRTKIKAVKYLGNKCSICGYDKCLGVLQFHHTDATQKEFSISGKSISWEKIQKELDKCVLVCANCHGEIHYKNNMVELLPERKIPICESCGKELKQLHNKFCKDCFKQPSKIDWPEDKELEKLIKEASSLTALGRNLGISDNAIRKHCQRRNIPFKKIG